MRTIVLGLLLQLTLLHTGWLGAAEGTAGFKKKPAVTKTGDTITISFAVAAPTDVEVAVLDSQDKVVRHLAAGVLGAKNAPPEPLKEGFVQSLAWDGKDDLGKPAAGGPFKARVRLGMSVKFGRIIGTSPYSGKLSFGMMGSWNGLATDADGTLYVKLASRTSCAHQTGVPFQLRKFDRTGQYQKTLLPYPPSTDPAKTSGFRLIDAGDGLLTPGHHSGLEPVLFKLGDYMYNRIVDGSVVFINHETVTLNFLKLDGSNTIKTVPMQSALGKFKPKSILFDPQMALSPDGKYAYYSNVAGVPYPEAKKPSDIDPAFPQGRIYRQDLTKPGSDPERFFDLELPDWEKTKYWMPNGVNMRTAAAGLDVDAQGHLYVCDLVNQEVVEVSPEGKKLNAAKVPWPNRVCVGRKSGNVYVVSREVKPNYNTSEGELIKLTRKGADAKVAARLPLKRAQGHSLALDESGNVPVLWVGGDETLQRVEDRDSQLAASDNLLNPKDAISFVCYGDVDPETEMVYVTESMGRVWRYNGETGEGGLLPFKAMDVVIGPGGMIYGWSEVGQFYGPVARYTRDCKPAPLSSTGKNTYGFVSGRFGRGNMDAGFAVDDRGWIYAVCGYLHCSVRVFDADGKLVEYSRKEPAGDGQFKGKDIPVVLANVSDRGGGLKVDKAHNIYINQYGLPKDFAVPKGFEKDAFYLQGTGTIYKFTSQGGEFKGDLRFAREPVGAVRAYPGCGPSSGGFDSVGCCVCTHPRFGLDGYGRLYIPNGITFKVSVRDNADNEIVRFGGYGNWDAQGPKSAEPKPEIPLGWPVFACPSEKYVYVGDGLNHRVVRVDRSYAAEESCEAQ